MKALNIQFGQAVRLIQTQGLTGRLHGPNLARAFEQRFNYLEGPRTAAQFDTSKGVVFQHGALEGVVIDKFTIFNDGFVCEAKVATEFADRIIDEVLVWAQKDAGYEIPPERLTKAGRMYLSRVDFEANVMLDQAIKGFSKVGSMIAESLRGYGVVRASDYAVSGLHFHIDSGAQEPTSSMPPAFLFERQINQPFSARRYFSSAPLSTADHVAVLEALEETLND
jgi:hypothetical protein